MEETATASVRTFASGATRDSAEGKFDYEGFLSPLVLERFAAYMHQHRQQSDGQLRASDNWQKGIGQPVYMSSAWRHFFDWWRLHRGWGPVTDIRDGHHVTVDEALCGLLFNVQGYLHELLKEQRQEQRKETAAEVDTRDEKNPERGYIIRTAEDRYWLSRGEGTTLDRDEAHRYSHADAQKYVRAYNVTTEWA